MLQDRSASDIVTVLGFYAAWTGRYGRFGASVIPIFSYQSQLRNTTEELRTDLPRGGPPKSRGGVCRFDLIPCLNQQQVTMWAVVM